MKFFLLTALTVSCVFATASARLDDLFHKMIYARQLPADFPPQCIGVCQQFADGSCPALSECQCSADGLTSIRACLQCGADTGGLTPDQLDQLIQQITAACATATSGTISPTTTTTDTGATSPTATGPRTTITDLPSTTGATTRTGTGTGTGTSTGTGTAVSGSETNTGNGALPTGAVGGFVKAGVAGAVAALVVL